MIRHWPGTAAAILVALLTLGPLVAIAFRADDVAGFTSADWSALRFTILQAVISAAVSTLLAIPLARALARRQFIGKSVLVTLLGAPFILPVIVAVLGLLAVFGRSGLLSAVLGWLGLDPVQVYGLHGVVLAHVFFNLPLATRLILQGWLAVPSEQFRLAASLGFRTADVNRVCERPILRAVLPGTFMVIFVICTTSFAVALMLGGGPKATTIELAIYQAFRFEFNLGKGALLALTQFAICAAAAGVALRVRIPEAATGGLDRTVERWDARAKWVRCFDAGWILIASAFLLLPLSMVVLSGLPGLLTLTASTGEAVLRSVIVAIASAILCVGLALPLAIAARRLRSRLLESVGYLAISASPLVIGTGLFLIIYPFVNPATLSLPVTALVNAVMSLPFALRALMPELAQVEDRFGNLADGLGLTGIARLQYLYLPRLRRPLGFSAGLAAALSMGDLGVIVLFSDPEGVTLPLQLYRLMAAYRMEQAAGVAVLLLAITMFIFWMFDRGGRVNVDL